MPPARARRCVHRRYHGHFRKDSRLYSYPQQGGAPNYTTYYLTPKGGQSHAGRNSAAAGCLLSRWRGRQGRCGMWGREPQVALGVTGLEVHGICFFLLEGTRLPGEVTL